MMNKTVFLLTILATLLSRSVATAQSVETYAGQKRVGVDLMWYKFFKNRKDEKSHVLFFSRNRASTDYNNTPTAFGSTNAVSWNFKNGLGLVGVASFLNSGFTPKAGLQLVKSKGDFLFFGWFVADLKKHGNVDLFGLLRYQPSIGAQWRLFSQLELFPVYNPETGFLNITQRLRLGLKHRAWAAGLMSDFNQSGKKNGFTQTSNAGLFLRHDF